MNGRTYAAPKRPTVVIIVDGFDPAYLEHGIANGTLPTMKSFKQNGFMGIADCSMPSTTNTNNTSIVTGVPPVIHGINGNYYLDAATGEEIMITDAKRLRCGTILGALSHVGVKTAVVTAKDKLLKVLAYEMEGINFSSEYAGKASLKENGIENVEKLVGRPTPDQYSADLSLFVFDAGVKLLSTVRPDLMYLSTSDYVQHKHAPGEPEADAYHHAVDKTVAALIALGATVAITADHGMNDKSRPGRHAQCHLSRGRTEFAVRRRHRPRHLPDRRSLRPASRRARFIRPRASAQDRRRPGDDGVRPDLARRRAGARQGAGVQAIRASDRPRRRFRGFQRSPDRGRRAAGGSQSQPAGGASAALAWRSRRTEGPVPAVAADQCSSTRRRAKAGPLHNYDIFDFALNGVE